MKYEVVENADEWIVRREGVELARFRGQDDALGDVAERLRATEHGDGAVSLSVRYAGGPLLQAGPPAGFEQFVGSSPDRPQVIARFTGGEAGVLSGLMRNPDQTRNRPMVVDAASGKGRIIMFANNPIYRWQTFGEHGMVFNGLLFWNDMPEAAAGAKPTATAPAQQ